MKRLLVLVIIFSTYLNSFGQCPNVDYTGNPEYINVPNKPSATTLQDMIGLTCGREWDGIYLNNRQDEVDFTKVGSFVRIFHEMQRDYVAWAVQNGAGVRDWPAAKGMTAAFTCRY